VRGLAIVAILMVATSARADVVRIVVRDGGLAVSRLRGQLADLDVEVRIAPDALEPTLDAQLATAAHLADAEGARAVVWFVPHDRGIAVAIATPGDHRLFVREIPAADASAVAEAAAVAARGAVRAIMLGGTIGVEVPAATTPPPVEAPPPVAIAGEHTSLEAALGWQAAVDGGADRGAQALAQRTTIARGAWAASLSLTLGASMHHAAANGVALELARSGGMLGVERRFGAFAIGVSAGALLYHRTTLSAPDGLVPTPDASTIAFVVGPEVSWRWREGRVGLLATAGLDLVAGAPDPAVDDGGTIESVGHVRAIQPRVSLSIFVRLP
jgi:hypothetical protein